MRLRRVPLLVSLAMVAGCDKATEAPKQNPQDPSPSTSSKPSAAPTSPGIRFEECAESSGLRFKMNFLPDEQGEHFKIRTTSSSATSSVRAACSGI
jgi:hypothetical protein